MSAILNTISYYSLMRGVLSPETICCRARESGYSAVALTDRNNLYALPEFLYQADKYGIRPIVAAEVVHKNSSVLVYSKADAGYANLCALLSNLHCSKDFSLATALACNTAGLYAVTDDIPIIRLISNKMPAYFRIKRPRLPPVEVKRLSIPCLIVPECAFLCRKDYETHRLLRAIDNNTSLSKLSVTECISKDSLIFSWQDICSRFEVFERALADTEHFADNILSRNEFGKIIFPDLESQEKAIAILRQKSFNGALTRYRKLNQSVIERLEYELEIIGNKGFASYFLIVDDIVRQSPRTCGRGSAAASLVAYCLGITNVDPIRYNLMFERFLNRERKDPPDIDIDFAWDERDSVLDYVFKRYGKEHAAMVATHCTFGHRMALRETARVYGLTETEISDVTAKLPYYFTDIKEDNAIDACLRHSETTKDMILDPPWQSIIADAQKIIGKPCAIGTHCGGVIITPGPISCEVPIQYSAKGYPIVQWEKEGVEQMGLVKIDLLGNRSLAVIRDAIANIRREGIEFNENRWNPAADPGTIALLAKGRTIGVFYVESPAMRLLQEKSGAGDFEHLVIHSSIIRPAANKYIREYLRRLHGGKYTPEHPLLGKILEETYGIMVYQEDVTKVAMALAGFSVVEGEELRKIITKKNRRDRLQKYCRRFYAGCRLKGLEKGKIDTIWEMIFSFSGYSFCKPHSASYVQVSFQSAWLKTHYPAAFMAAVISNFGGFYTTQAYISEAQRLNLLIEIPCVNTSNIKSISIRQTIRSGLHLIKGLSAQAQRAVVETRVHSGLYCSLEDILERSGIKERDAEQLVSAGACDCLEQNQNRSRLFWKLRKFYRGARSPSETVPALKPYSDERLVMAQYKALGFLVAMHPITLVRPQDLGKAVRIGRIRANIGRKVMFYGWCVTSRSLTTITGEDMQFVTFEDETGIIETVLFPKVYQEFTRYLAIQEAFLITGRVEQEFGAVTVNVLSLAPVR